MLQAEIYLATPTDATEHEDVQTIARVLQRYGLEGAFITRGYGLDSGSVETSYRVTISQYGIRVEVFKARIRQASLALRDVFTQDCVLVTYSDTAAECTHDYAKTEG